MFSMNNQLTYLLFYCSCSVFCLQVTPQRNLQFCAAWLETGKVHIWDLTLHIKSLDTPGYTTPKAAQTPTHTVDCHSTEGYALDWSPLSPGKLLSGDNHTHIYLTTKTESGFTTDQIPCIGHESSVEDIQWSPNEKNVFCSASADKTVKIWDLRGQRKPSLSVKAHETDVNVISWNK